MNQPFVELQEVCRFISGGTPSTKVPEYFMGTIPWITGADMNGNVITKARQYITEEAIQNSATNIVPKGNILLVTRTGVGKVAIAGADICISQDFTGLELDKTKVDEWYLLYYLRSQEEALISQQRGATIQGITRDVVETIRLPLPPLAEQKRIASLLARADRLRQLRRAANALADSLLQSVFLEMFGKPETNEKGWDYEIVDELCELVRGSSPRPQGDSRYFGGNVPRLMVADITRDGMYVTPNIDSLTELGAKQSRPMKAGDVVMVVSGIVGLPAILKIDACIHDGFVGFRNLDKRISSTYFYFLLLFMQKENSKQAAGAIWQNLTTDLIREWKIPLPPLSLQEEFAGVVARVEGLRARMAEAERQAEGLFQSLLALSFTEGLAQSFDGGQ